MSAYTWQKIRYPNSVGLGLSALLYSREPAGTVIIVCHGFTGSKEGGGRAIAMAEELGDRGYATLLFDFCGCGESEGEFADLTLTRHVGDLKTSVSYCRRLGFERILTMGRSFGGTAAICLGRAGGEVSGVCTWAAPGALGELFVPLRRQDVASSFSMLKLSEDDETLQIKKEFLTDLNAFDVFSRAGWIAPSPFLIIHGAKDEVVPEKNARFIYQSAGAPKRLKIIENGDHQFTGCHEEVWKEYFAWLAEFFPI